MLSPTAVLVPVPKSSLFKEGSLWVPEQIANSFVRSGLGGRSARLLARTRAIAKAATSLSSGRPRPTALDHLQTLAVQTELRSVEEIVLIDDVVTTGSTLLGCANKLLESYPSSLIRGFAVMRAVSNPVDFKQTLDPIVGAITFTRTAAVIANPDEFQRLRRRVQCMLFPRKGPMQPIIRRNMDAEPGWEPRRGAFRVPRAFSGRRR